MDAVLLAAGEGTRLRPLTNTRPKPMLPIAGKPILEWSLEALDCVGVKKVLIVVGYKKKAILERFGDKFRGLKIKYIEQKSQLGTGDALAQAESQVTGDFLVLNGDLFVTRGFLSSIVDKHERNPSTVSVALVDVSDPRGYGVVETKGKKITALSEKPKKPKSNTVNAGVYVFNERIFDELRQLKRSSRMEFELTDAIKRLIKKGEAKGYKCEGQWIDIGLPWNLLDANEIVMKSIKQYRSKKAVYEKYTTLKGQVHVGEGSVIRSGSYIEGPVFIGKNSVVGPNCYIRAYTAIMDDCRVGNAVEVKNSIVMSKTCIGHLSYVGDSVVGENCNFGAGTKVANLRFDDGEVSIEVKNKMVKSGRRKLGCIMGDNVKTGINVSVMPGRSIYPDSNVEAGSVVKNTIYSD